MVYGPWVSAPVTAIPAHTTHFSSRPDPTRRRTVCSAPWFRYLLSWLKSTNRKTWLLMNASSKARVHQVALRWRWILDDAVLLGPLGQHRPEKGNHDDRRRGPVRCEFPKADPPTAASVRDRSARRLLLP